MTFIDFLNSNLLQTIVVLITGFVALLIYIITKMIERRDAARILLNEIRSAERTIIDIKNNKRISELSIILTSNSWKQFNHLFVKIFDVDEYNPINDFYNKCDIAEKLQKILLSNIK